MLLGFASHINFMPDQWLDNSKQSIFGALFEKKNQKTFV